MSLSIDENLAELSTGVKGKKSLIAVLTSYDAPGKHNELVKFLNQSIIESSPLRSKLENFWFIFTGGTFNRLFGQDDEDSTAIQIIANQKSPNVNAEFDVLNSDAMDFLKHRSICLPSYRNGGVTILSYLISQKKIRIIWPLFSSLTSHSSFPANYALLRLCDIKGVKRLDNIGHITEWLTYESNIDSKKYQQNVPFGYITLKGGEKIHTVRKQGCVEKIPCRLDQPTILNHRTSLNPAIALISDKTSRKKLLQFVTEHKESFKSSFYKLLTTKENTPALTKIFRNEITKGIIQIVDFNSEKNGGYVEITNEVLFGRCDYVLAFRDPSLPQQYPPDIESILNVGQIKNNVRVFTNKDSATDWIRYTLPNFIGVQNKKITNMVHKEINNKKFEDAVKLSLKRMLEIGGEDMITASVVIAIALSKYFNKDLGTDNLKKNIQENINQLVTKSNLNLSKDGMILLQNNVTKYLEKKR